MPNVGPWEGCRKQAMAFRFLCAVRAWTNPTSVVLLPSPNGVGVILKWRRFFFIEFWLISLFTHPATTTYFPSCSFSNLFKAFNEIFAFFVPYRMTSSLISPISSARFDMSFGSCDRDMEMSLDGNKKNFCYFDQSMFFVSIWHEPKIYLIFWLNVLIRTNSWPQIVLV